MKSDAADFFLEIAVTIHPVAHEALSAFFFDLGCPGVVSESFHDRVFRSYLPSSADSKELRTRIRTFVNSLERIFPETWSATVSFDLLENRDWTTLWREYYRPLRISEKLTVFPAWETVPAIQEGLVIRIDPGPAFGTGEHATTGMCLKAIETLAPDGDWSMLDVGTGSGILAMYGAMLGAATVTALDNDPEALRWAERNITLNGLLSKIQLSAERLQDIRGRFALVAANLTLGTILEMMPYLCAALEPRGRLILSGMLTEHSQTVTDALSRAGFQGVQACQEEEWLCITAQ